MPFSPFIMYYPKQPNQNHTKMYPVYFEHDALNIAPRFAVVIDYITAAIYAVILNRLVSYIFIDSSYTNDASLTMAERGEYNKNTTQKNTEDIIERGEFYRYRVL